MCSQPINSAAFAALLVCAAGLFPAAPVHAQVKLADARTRMAPRAAAHGKLPTDPRYWEFNRWYRGHSVLDVFINGSDQSHLEAVLGELGELKKRGVLIRNITVIGGNNFAQLDRSTRSVNPSASAIRAKAAELNVGEGRAAGNWKSQVERMRLRYSPTWIVTVRGKQHLFEGVENMKRVFSRRGEFSGAPDEGTVQQGSFPIVSGSKPGQVFRYQLADAELPRGTGTYDVKPACAANTVRRVAVLYDSKELSEFDMTFYDYEDKHQAQSAFRKKTPTVPYLIGDMHNPYRNKNSLQQNFARFFDVRCLPTRLHYVFENGRRFEEYREGSLAWE